MRHIASITLQTSPVSSLSMTIFPPDEILPSIDETQKDKITIDNQRDSYLIISPIPITEVYVYDIDGRCLHAEKANSKRLKINKTSSWNTCSVIRIDLSNGEMETIKLKP